MAKINAPHFTDETEARKYLENIRWPQGTVCPHCGTVGSAYNTKKAGVYRCASKECRKDFSVTVGTVYERSHIPLHKWLLASYLLCSSKKGISSHQLHRMLDVTYKSAWFMTHRIREAMKPTGNEPPLGGGGKIVEADETYVGGVEKNKPLHKRKSRGKVGGGTATKEVVVSVVERDGKVRSEHITAPTTKCIAPVLKKYIKEDSLLFTDEAPQYKSIGKEFIAHHSVNHSVGEYALGGYIHTNTIEGFFGIFKRGVKGTYQHCKPVHLKRYLAEFDFRYNNRSGLGIEDSERADIVLKAIEGKRLTYNQPRKTA